MDLPIESMEPQGMERRMNVTIELTPEEEARLSAAAKREGLDPVSFARQLLRRNLPPVEAPGTDTPDVEPNDALRARLRQWQAQDRTPLLPSIPTRELASRWRAEDARMTDAERDAEDRFWDEFLRDVNATRDALGMRRL